MSSFFNKIWIKIALALLLIVAIERFCYKETAGFRPYKVHSSLSFDSRWEIAPPTPEKNEEIDRILSQDFYFLGSGVQVYAFISEDKKHVLKLFKHHRSNTASWFFKIPLPSFLEPYRQRIYDKRNDRREAIFTSFKIAYEECLDETALIYLHLNKTPSSKRTLTLYDKLHIAHRFPLDQMEFVLQEYALPAEDKIKQLLQKGEVEKARLALENLFNLLEIQCEKGVINHDISHLIRNLGFVGEKAIAMDLGSFSKSSDPIALSQCQEEMEAELIKLLERLSISYPELSDKNKELQEDSRFGNIVYSL